MTRNHKDPVSENMNVIKGKPVKAFIYQDHEAHITTHTAMQDPMIMQMIGQNPMAQQMMAAATWQAHIAEQHGFEYRQMIEQLGVPTAETRRGNARRLRGCRFRAFAQAAAASY